MRGKTPFLPPIRQHTTRCAAPHMPPPPLPSLPTMVVGAPFPPLHQRRQRWPPEAIELLFSIYAADLPLPSHRRTQPRADAEEARHSLSKHKGGKLDHHHLTKWTCRAGSRPRLVSSTFPLPPSERPTRGARQSGTSSLCSTTSCATSRFVHLKSLGRRGL